MEEGGSMKTPVVKVFFTVYGIKKRCRKVDFHTETPFDTMTLTEFEQRRDTLIQAFRAHINTNFKSVGHAKFSYWPGEREDGSPFEQFRPMSAVTIERIEATRSA